MNQYEIVILMSLLFTLLGAGFTLFMIFKEFPKYLWEQFKVIREKEAEEAKSKLLESEEREKYEAWRRSKRGASSPSRSFLDKPTDPSDDDDSDDLDIHDPDNWY